MQDDQDGGLLARADEALDLRTSIEKWQAEIDAGGISPERRKDLRTSIRLAEKRCAELLRGPKGGAR